MTVNKTIRTSATETFGIQGYPREKKSLICFTEGNWDG